MMIPVEGTEAELPCELVLIAKRFPGLTEICHRRIWS